MIEQLITKLITTPVGNRKLDAEIDSAFTGWFPSHLCNCSIRHSYSNGFVHRLDDGSFLLTQDGRVTLKYSTSLDDAKTLLPEGFQWLCRSLKDKRGFANITKDFKPKVTILANGQTVDDSTGTSFRAYGSTPELALCAALLKARNQTNVGNS